MLILYHDKDSSYKIVTSFSVKKQLKYLTTMFAFSDINTNQS